jgi:hypothetical protein
VNPVCSDSCTGVPWNVVQRVTISAWRGSSRSSWARVCDLVLVAGTPSTSVICIWAVSGAVELSPSIMTEWLRAVLAWRIFRDGRECIDHAGHQLLFRSTDRRLRLLVASTIRHALPSRAQRAQGTCSGFWTAEQAIRSALQAVQALPGTIPSVGGVCRRKASADKLSVRSVGEKADRSRSVRSHNFATLGSRSRE